MVSGPTLKQQLDQRVGELKQTVAGVSEDKATARSGEGEWCVKEVLSHLSGDDHALGMYEFKRFVEEDTPELGITPGVSYFGPEREKASVPELVSTIEEQYSEIGTFLSGLNDEQLARKAHIAFLKETPVGEYPTLAQWSMAIINFHLPDHISQLRTLCQ